MKDIQKVKYVNLMTEIEDLEDEVYEYENREGISSEIESDAEIAEDLKVLAEKLATKRNELARLSDGCGHNSHNHSS